MAARITDADAEALAAQALIIERHYGRPMDMEWAMGIQNKVSRTVGEAMRNFDVLLTPGLGRDVAKLGELNQNRRGVDVMSWWKQLMYDYTQYTPLFNTTGQPAMMLPLFQSKSGLPLAMQFVGRLGDEETLYSLANQLEQALPWSQRRAENFS